MTVSLISRAMLRAMCCALALLAADKAVAGSKPGGPAVASTTEAKSEDAPGQAVSLAALGNIAGPLRLAGMAASKTISIPVSEREKVQGAALHLVVSNSVSLLTDRSQLVVRVNDRTVAQLQLSARQPEATADIQIPAELLRAGYNGLTFAVAEHSTENCEDPDAPELWSEIDTTASTLSMRTALKPLTPVLADLSDLMDPKQWAMRSVAIVPAAHPGNDLQLASGGLLAQGIALRLRYLASVPRVLDAQPGAGAGMLPGLDLAPLAGSDLLLIGTREALRPYLDPQTLARIHGGFLAVYPKPDDPRRFVLVVSGRDDNEVNRAARAFAHPQLPLPRRSELLIDSFDEKALPPWSAGHTISGTAPHTFRELGFRSRTLRRGDRADVEIVLPADIYAPEDAQVVFDMNFTEGAKMRGDSVLNIFLNDRFEQVIALDQPQGAVMHRYRVSIPLRDFRSGANTLSLRAALVPLMTDRCLLRQTDNLMLTLFDDSTLTLPPASHFATLPDLKRFGDSGFPYTVLPDGSGLAVQVASRDNGTLAAAWSLLGKLAQQQQVPLTYAQVRFGEPQPGRQAIIIGATDALPAPALAGAPWLPGHSVSVGNASPDDGAQGWLARHGGGFFKTSAELPSGTGATLRGAIPLSRQLLVMQFRGKRQDTVTVLTSASTADLQQGVAQLVDPGNWTGLEGDVAVLNTDRTGLWTARIGSTYEAGTLDVWDWLGFVLSRHPWLGYAALVLLIAVFAASTALLLQRYHRNQHRDAEN